MAHVAPLAGARLARIVALRALEELGKGRVVGDALREPAVAGTAAGTGWDRRGLNCCSIHARVGDVVVAIVVGVDHLGR
eukprot:8763244-Alexandrium_andersonii.AAC.1